MIIFPKKCPVYNAGKLYKALTGEDHLKKKEYLASIRQYENQAMVFIMRSIKK